MQTEGKTWRACMHAWVSAYKRAFVCVYDTGVLVDKDGGAQGLGHWLPNVNNAPNVNNEGQRSRLSSKLHSRLTAS